MIFPKHRDAISVHLEPIEQQLSTVNNAIQRLDTAKDEISAQREAIEADIQGQFRQLHEALEVRKTELIGQLDQMTQRKVKTLSVQRGELELIQTRLNSCLQFVSDNLKSGSEGEILAVEKPVVQQVKEMCAEFDPNHLPPQEQADMILVTSRELLPACQQFGQISCISPEKCYATGGGQERATVGEQSTVTVHAVDGQGSIYSKPLPDTHISCELVSCITAERTNCDVKSTKSGEYEISYRPTHRGRHQLHIKVSDQLIRVCPFTVVAKGEIGAPIRTITGLKCPWGVAVNERGQIIIAENDGHCISIYNPNGKKIKSFGLEGSAPGEFDCPRGVAVDRSGNILISSDHCIKKFTGDGHFIAKVVSYGDKPCRFHYPYGIAISRSDKVYVCDKGNHRVQILNSDLTFSGSFGSEGSSDGQFKYPWDVAFDNHGNVYLADCDNHRIQVFTEHGRFLGKFGVGTLDRKSRCHVKPIAERSNHRISLFTSESNFLSSFGKPGDGPFPRSYITVDDDGFVYVTEEDDGQVHVF